MPWDHFCPNCSSALAGGMSDGLEMDKEMLEFNNKCKVIFCKGCEIFYDYDTNKILGKHVPPNNTSIVRLDLA